MAWFYGNGGGGSTPVCVTVTVLSVMPRGCADRVLISRAMSAPTRVSVTCTNPPERFPLMSGILKMEHAASAQTQIPARIQTVTTTILIVLFSEASCVVIGGA